MNENSSTARDTDHQQIVWRVDRYRRTDRRRPGFVRSRTMTAHPSTEPPQQRSLRSKWKYGLLAFVGIKALEAVPGELVGHLVDAALAYLGTL